MQESLSDLPIHMGEVPSLYAKEKNSLSMRQGCLEESKQQALLSFPQFITLGSYLFLSYHIFPWLSIPHQI